MLRSINAIMGYRIVARDDEFGDVKDFYFDDWTWTVRYLVLDTGRWLPGRRVLLSPLALREPDWNRPVLPVALTRQQIESSPPISEDVPVSRESEALLAKYYGWMPYWESLPLPEHLSKSYARESRAESRQQVEAIIDSTLRSFGEVKGYEIAASDGELGSVADFIVETNDWVLYPFKAGK